MDILITGKSALTLTREARTKQARISLRPLTEHEDSFRPQRLDGALLRSLDLSLLTEVGVWAAGRPLDLCVSTTSERTRVHGIRCHIRSTSKDRRLYQRLCPTNLALGNVPQQEACRILVEAPPLLFASQATELHGLVRAGHLSREAAIMRLASLACELCGTYARDPLHPLDGAVAYELAPLCSTEDLRAFLAAPRGIRGIDLARAATRIATDMLASPMELICYAALAFPPRYGGVHLMGLLANKALGLTEEQLRSLGVSRITPDFRIEGWPVALEYNGSEHLEKYRVRQDKDRAQNYAKLGIVHFPLMIDDVRTTAALDKTLRDILDLLTPYGGVALRKRVQRILRDRRYQEARALMLELYLPKSLTQRDAALQD